MLNYLYMYLRLYMFIRLCSSHTHRPRAAAARLVQGGRREADPRRALRVVRIGGRRALGAQQQLIRHAQQRVPCARARRLSTGAAAAASAASVARPRMTTALTPP